MALVILAAGSWTLTCGFDGCPSDADIQAFRPNEGSRVLDRSGAMLGRLEYVRRVNVPLSRVPRHVRAAFIAVEDRRFYYHHGVDWRSAARALVRNVTRADVSEGFSTITMQVVRNAFVPRLAQERSFRRKLIEVYLAGRLERSLSKQQILALYLNVIYLGNGAYGVEAASRDLFGKSVERLTVAEGATLAGAGARSLTLRPAPARRPRGRPAQPGAHGDGARALPQRFDAARGARAPPPALTRRVAARAGALFRAGCRPRRGRLPARRCPAGRPHRLHVAGRPSAACRRERGAPAGRRDRPRGGRPPGRARDTLQGAFVALDPRNGELRAVVGGRRYVPRGFNRALVARRQPGSAFKPFVYAAALDDGLTPAAVVMDTPVEIPGKGGIWRPANFDGRVRRAAHASASAHALGQRGDRSAGRSGGRAAGGVARAPRRHPQPVGRGALPGPRRAAK